MIRVAREFAENAEQTRGKSMIIMGSGINHWFHSDMTDYHKLDDALRLSRGEWRRLGSLYGPGKSASGSGVG